MNKRLAKTINQLLITGSVKIDHWIILTLLSKISCSHKWVKSHYMSPKGVIAYSHLIVIE